MKRAVLSVDNPQDYINDLNNYSIMVVNPGSTETRLKYLLDNSDYTVLITNSSTVTRNGNDYPNEKLFWYTSGTTGDSKFYSFTQEQVTQMAHTICNSYKLTSNDRYVSIMPLWHAHGQGFYWATQLAGCETHYATIKDIKNIPKYNPTFITAIPDILKIIGKFDFSNLRFIRSASSALPNSTYSFLKEKFNVPVIEAFGMTEALSHCFTNPLEGEQKIGTVGLPDGIEADIVDGQLYIKGSCVFSKTWFNTGDLASRDRDGYYTILGRHRDQINIRGIKINPVSLESQLIKNIPGLVNCTIFGKDQLKCLFVGKCTSKDIIEYLLNLGTHCRPTFIQQLNEIPLSPSGKISRTWLDTQF